VASIINTPTAEGHIQWGRPTVLFQWGRAGTPFPHLFVPDCLDFTWLCNTNVTPIRYPCCNRERLWV